MIHSGSRNLGHKICTHYNNLAKELNNRWYSSVPKEHQLAFLPLDSEEGQNYFKEMHYCVKFASENRLLMMENVKQSFLDILPDVEFSGLINVAHNYARMENHFGKNVMVHRKGAVSAKLGEKSAIPGSQGASSFLVTGKGEKQSFESSSHGSGRKIGRKQAIRELNFEEQKEILDSQEIIHGMRTTKSLDEAPGAYKDIHTVMDNQKDLVDIVVELTPLASIKG